MLAGEFVLGPQSDHCDYDADSLEVRRQIVLESVKVRVLIVLGSFAFLLASMQALAYLTAVIAEFQHPPIGQFVTVDGVRLHYVSKGSGRPVVFIHGNDGMVLDFDLAVLGAAAAKYRAIAFDRPGHGYSQRESDRIATLEVQSRLIHDALQKLGIKRPMIVGHSWGGALALDYALKYPDDTAGIVLLSGVAYKTADTGPHAQDLIELVPVVGDLLISSFVVTARPWVEQATAQAFWPQTAPRKYVEGYSALVLRPGQIKAYAQDELTLNDTLTANSSHYGEIRVPVVIVTGDLDIIVPPDLHAKPLHEAISNSSMIVIPGAGHQIELVRVDPIINAIDQAWMKVDAANPTSTELSVKRSSK